MAQAQQVDWLGQAPHTYDMYDTRSREGWSLAGPREHMQLRSSRAWVETFLDGI